MRHTDYNPSRKRRFFKHYSDLCCSSPFKFKLPADGKCIVFWSFKIHESERRGEKKIISFNIHFIKPWNMCLNDILYYTLWISLQRLEMCDVIFSRWENINKNWEAKLCEKKAFGAIMENDMIKFCCQFIRWSDLNDNFVCMLFK